MYRGCREREDLGNLEARVEKGWNLFFFFLLVIKIGKVRVKSVRFSVLDNLIFRRSRLLVDLRAVEEED